MEVTCLTAHILGENTMKSSPQLRPAQCLADGREASKPHTKRESVEDVIQPLQAGTLGFEQHVPLLLAVWPWTSFSAHFLVFTTIKQGL